MVRFDSYRAASRGNRASRNLVKKSTLGGQATLQAVTRVKLEQASKAAMWTPTRRTNGEGRDDWEEPGAGARYRITVGTSRSTGVVSTACKEGNLRQWGRLGMVGESRIWFLRSRIAETRSDGWRYSERRLSWWPLLCLWSQDGAIATWWSDGCGSWEL